MRTAQIPPTNHVPIRCILLLAAAALLGACTGEQRENDRDPVAATPPGGMPGRDGMQGMHDGTGETMGGMGPEMQTHMRRMMGGLRGEQITAMLPTHRQMVANMLSRMNGEMRQMDMAADASWTATVDSLRHDLVRLPELGAAELEATMPAHLARVRRLGEMHQDMMGSMKR